LAIQKHPSGGRDNVKEQEIEMNTKLRPRKLARYGIVSATLQPKPYV